MMVEILGGIVIGLILGYIIFGRKKPDTKLREENIKLKAQLEAEENNIDKFEVIADKVLSKQTTKSGAELKKALDPLTKDLTSFKNRLEDLNTKRAEDNRALKEHITGLKETSDSLGEEAANLTKALRGDKQKQGAWGEVTLERLLEQSGLVKDREYSVQPSLANEEGGKSRPDVIVKLPDEKSVIIDSKVSLNAYVDYSNAEEEKEAVSFLRQHVQAIDKHIKTLGAKNYEKLEGVHTLEYVLMFLPLEAAFFAALREDSDLYDRGMAQNIIIVSPTTLLATLKVIHNLWRNERKVQNAMEIAREGGKLYDKFYGFIEDMTKIGKSIDQAQQSYDSATKKLYDGRGNLLTQSKNLGNKVGRKNEKAATDEENSIVDNVEHMKSLGAETKKQIPDK